MTSYPINFLKEVIRTVNKKWGFNIETAEIFQENLIYFKLSGDKNLYSTCYINKLTPSGEMPIYDESKHDEAARLFYIYQNGWHDKKNIKL